MNDGSKTSSSQNQMNTTHFNNRNVLGNGNRFNNYTGIRPITPRNNAGLEQKRRESISSSAPNNKKTTNNNTVQNRTSKPSFGPKNKINNNVGNLRNALNTNPDLKDELVKKGAEALKKSADPYSKAAGYALSALQKRKEKKREKEEKEKEERDNEEDDSNNTEKESLISEKQSAVIKKLMPILMILAPLLLIFIIVIGTLLPVISAYSWFFSVFNSKSDDAESYYVHTKSEQKYLEQEKAFNEAVVGSKDGSVKGIIQEYKEKYGVTLDKYLLVATVTYKYTMEDNSDNLYNDEDLGEISEDDINDNLESLDDGNNSDNITNNDDSNKIDYSAAKKKLETVASLMLINNNGSYTTDNNVGGEYYKMLIDSSFLKSYYKKQLADNEYSTRQKLVDDIFTYADGARDMFGDDEEDDSVSGGVVSGSSVIHLQTCKQAYNYQTINNLQVYNNPSWSEGTSYSDSLNLRDYLKGVLMSEVDEFFSKDNIEGLKAQTIAALTFLVNDTNSGFNLKSGEMYFPAGTCRQVTCSPTDGCTVVVRDGFDTAFVGVNRFGSEGYNHTLSAENDQLLEEVLNDVFGKIMVKKGVTSASFSGSSDVVSINYYNSTSNGDCKSGACMGQIEAMQDARSGKTYTDILNKYYANISFDIIDIQEGLYTSGGYANAKYNGEVIYYSQGSYSNAFCGRNDATISSAGCGVTSSAIVASSLTGNKQYNPVYMMNWAYKEKTCGTGISGTDARFFEIFARALGLGYQKVSKSEADKVVAALKTGKALVIAHMGSGHFTDNGHYIVLSAINEKGEVYVNDPNNNKHSGYWNINLIANEISDHGDFHIISRT